MKHWIFYRTLEMMELSDNMLGEFDSIWAFGSYHDRFMKIVKKFLDKHHDAM